MQDVQLVESEQIDELLGLVHREKVACDVHHCAAIREAWLIDDGKRGNRPLGALGAHIGFDISGQQLADGLDTVKQSGRTICH